ncbi:MAG: IS1182 family transposase [Terriglobales bacterium]
MAFIQGEARGQGTMFPVTLEELIPGDHVCRVIEAFVEGMEMGVLGFERAEAAETGRPGYDPRALLKLYLYGYLQQVRSSRRLEAESKRNVEVMWLLGRLQPDHKSIAEFRRRNGAAITEACAELVSLARAVGLVRGEWVAIDGSKFQAASSAVRVAEREAAKRYLERVEAADQEEEIEIDETAVAAALKKLAEDREPEARFMHGPHGSSAPAYNVQIAVDSEHAIMVAQAVTTEANDKRSLLPMAEAAKAALGGPAELHVVADAGYSNGEQAETCERKGIVPHVAVQRSINNQGDGSAFDRSQFSYNAEQDRFYCPAGQTLERKGVKKERTRILYQATVEACGGCVLKTRCTQAKRRTVYRHLHEEALERMGQRATAEAMRLRRSCAEHPFASLKYWIFGHPRFLLRGQRGAQSEMSLAVLVYNLKRMLHVLGAPTLIAKLARA